MARTRNLRHTRYSALRPAPVSLIGRAPRAKSKTASSMYKRNALAGRRFRSWEALNDWLERWSCQASSKIPPLYHLKFPPPGVSWSGWGSARGKLSLGSSPSPLRMKDHQDSSRYRLFELRLEQSGLELFFESEAFSFDALVLHWVGYTSSSLSVAKKLSATALSQQFPLRLMLAMMPCCASNC